MGEPIQIKVKLNSSNSNNIKLQAIQCADFDNCDWDKNPNKLFIQDSNFSSTNNYLNIKAEGCPVELCQFLVKVVGSPNKDSKFSLTLTESMHHILFDVNRQDIFSLSSLEVLYFQFNDIGADDILYLNV